MPASSMLKIMGFMALSFKMMLFRSLTPILSGAGGILGGTCKPPVKEMAKFVSVCFNPRRQIHMLTKAAYFQRRRLESPGRSR